jgi:uncharacterized membrane protein
MKLITPNLQTVLDHEEFIRLSEHRQIMDRTFIVGFVCGLVTFGLLTFIGVVTVSILRVL